MLQQLSPLGENEHKAQFGQDLQLEILLDKARWSLRIAPQDLAHAETAFGISLPKKIGNLTKNGDKIALCIGPDEWYLMAAESDAENIEAAFENLYKTTLHSLVDVSHREISLIIKGAKAGYLLQAAIAFDIEKMAANTGCRTIIDKSQIILMKLDESTFCLEVWNSYADHVWHLLQTIGKEIELNI